jgi:hypothetical protein
MPDDDVILRFDGWRLATQTQYDRDDDTELAATIVYAVADVKGVDPLDPSLPPLYDSVDAAALEETFFGPRETGPERDESGAVTFTYDGCKVALQSDGWISIYESVEP